MGFLCWFGKHRYEDKIKITGPRTEDGLPVRVYQVCKRCYKIGNDVNCFVNPPNEDQLEK